MQVDVKNRKSSSNAPAVKTVSMAAATPLRPSIVRVLQQTTRLQASGSLALPVRASGPHPQNSTFSTSAALSERRANRDNNRLRGLSSLYRSGTKGRMVIDGFKTPKPANYKPEVYTDPDHGLWEFFYARNKCLPTPEEDEKHGRAWTVEELRHKSWEDLHKLWWVCVKERNRIATASRERRRLELKNGGSESRARNAEIWKTMKAIKHALTERYYVWEDARALAATDPEIDLSGEGNPYTPRAYLEEEEAAAATTTTETPVHDAEQQPKGSFMAEQPVAETVDPAAPPKTAEQQPATPRT